MRKLLETAGMGGVCALLFVAFAVFVPNFATATNLSGLLMSIATIGMVACTMMFCLAGGDFDLSVGSTVALAGVLAAMIINSTGNVALAVLLPLLAGAGIGAVNGFVIAQLSINPLIATLATQQMVRGAALLLTQGSSIGVSNDAFSAIGQAKLVLPIGPTGFPIQSPVWVTIACFVISGILLGRTTFGRNALAVGGNLEASRLAGVPVVRTKVLVFVLQGVVAALAGVLVASRVTSGQPNASQGLELQAISGCVLGGVSLTGGIARIGGVAVGVLIMGAVQNAMSLRNIDTFWQLVVSGAILLAAVLIDRAKRR